MANSEEVPENFRLAMRRLAASVSVMTLTREGERHGITLTSATSLSMEPSSMVTCIAETAAIYSSLVEGQPVAINMLTNGQKEISESFAWAKKGDDRFTVGDWQDDPMGRPLLAGAQANLLGIVEKVILYGTHGVVITRVDDVQVAQEVVPLLYMDGGYYSQLS